ncbi:MAG: amidohydrolase [Acidaminococcaceae bacterium]|nr:amidohydrolase [Acidaminococcaceae bacterium]
MSEVLKHYDELHLIPEPGFEEFKTAEYLAARLTEAGYKVSKNIGGTGVVAEYDSGNSGPVLGLRSDIDALTHIVDGKKVYRHTCGHDGHMAMLLTAAEEVAREKLVKRGRVKFIFQPAEELGTGAMRVLESGIIDDVDILLGMHVRPEQECPAGSVISAMLYSATCIFKAKIKGAPAHGARPHLGINSIDAATAAIVAVNAVHMDPRVPFSVKCTRFHADAGVFNAVPEYAEITFDMRAQNNKVMDEMKEKVFNAVKYGAASVGAEVVDIEIHSELPAADGIDPEITKILGECAAEVVGAENVLPPFETSGGEDFFYFITKRPKIKAGFTGLGVGAAPGLHHPEMNFDPKYLENGVAIHKKAIKRILG